MAYAYIEVDYSATARTNLQNDAHFKLTKAGLDPNGKFGGGRQKVLINQNVDSILYRDAINSGNGRYHEPTVQARQNLVHGGNLTPLEIGMYSLLGVFCVAIFVFVVTCTVFAVRYQNKRERVPTVENGESVAHAHDWVWLGRATLERNSVNTRCSQTLMPMSDFNGNAPPPASSSTLNSKAGSRATTLPEKKKAVSRMHRSSNISFPGSEISIRITTNPHQLTNDDDDEGIYDQEEKETTLIEGGAITSLTNHNAFHLPSESDLKTNNRSTLSKLGKNFRIHPNPLNKELQAKEPEKIGQFSTFTKSTSTRVTPPPVPPHRNSAIYSAHPNLPPPVPPHAQSRANPSTSGTPPSHSSMENENTKQMREILRNVNLTDNPLLASGEMDWESVSKGMNYEQLMEYFVNLKESNA